MTERRVVLDAAAFLDSPQAVSVGGAATPEIREIVQRFLSSCYQDAGKAPRLLQGDELQVLVAELLPRHFGRRDPLAGAVEEVLAAYLSFLEETEVVTHSFELRQALPEAAEAFRRMVHSGAAHGEGVAVTGPVQAVRHRGEKIGRNDPCPCGSGKKFKKCCLRLGR